MEHFLLQKAGDSYGFFLKDLHSKPRYFYRGFNFNSLYVFRDDVL